ncbi:MAG TPA: ADP-ribosylglycohydrolase family protein [Anaerolineales bacterium]|nr:ADP-ribosylglycohydrolase family protein [Anaerolineales bacterium]
MSLDEALLSLEGLSVGDAFGECFFTYPAQMIAGRELPPGPWPWTDDTHMALSIVDVLRNHGRIDQDVLARAFGRRYQQDPYRGYAAGARILLGRVSEGEDWRQIAPGLFDSGSYGNGAAMRVAPVGGFFAGEPEAAAEQARLSAEITHAHPEGQAGAMAVAAAAAVAASGDWSDGQDFIRKILPFVPQGLTREGIVLALEIFSEDLEEVATQLGTGRKISAMDTVPFCLWCAAHNLASYEDALWQTVAGLGDRDTTCAIVGGIVALSARKIPIAWVRRREPLPRGFAFRG